jgi:hypothetical protein
MIKQFGLEDFWLAATVTAGANKYLGMKLFIGETISPKHALARLRQTFGGVNG